jgi:DNA-binding SARP family transcriptional activator
MTNFQFNLLGPMTLTVAGQPQRLPLGKQRSLLATLLVYANQDVGVDRLTEYLWDDAPPRRPRAVLQTYVTRLRRTLAGYIPELSAAVQTASDGYRLSIRSEVLDLLQFRALVAESRRHAVRGDVVAEAETLTQAVALRRGPIMSDVRSGELERTVVPALTEEWLCALERRSELSFVRGGSTDLIPHLRVVTCNHPYRERLILLLMRALAEAGRRVEALEVYATARARFRASLGLDPGTELRELHLQILHGGPMFRSRLG